VKPEPNGILAANVECRGLSMAALAEQLPREPRKVTVGALVVESVGEQPAPDSPDLPKRLPPLPPPTFEVASVRRSPPNVSTAQFRFRNGEVNVSGAPLSTLIARAWNLAGWEYRLAFDLAGSELLIAPRWLDSRRFDIVARASAESMADVQDSETVAAMMRQLLVERFTMKYHTEERQMTPSLARRSGDEILFLDDLQGA
jgi:hypothetical protein